MALYDRVMELTLGIGVMHTYYEHAERFLARMNYRYWHLSVDQLKEVFRTSPVQVLGDEAVEKVMRRRLRLHAWRAGLVTFLCTLPTNWLMWPLMVVDIVYFQRELFLFVQEVKILYKSRAEYGRRIRFDYQNLALFSAKLMEPFVMRQVKNAVGMVGRAALKKGVRFARGPIRLFLRQIFKLVGVTATKELAEASIDLLVAFGCAVIAGFVSYWLFRPLARRLKYILQEETDG